MSQFRCVIQAGSNADTRADELERRLREHDAKHYPSGQVEVRWVPIPPGHMFTEGEQSTSSVVSCFVDHVTTLELLDADRNAVVNGTIRAGRTDAQKAEIADRLSRALAEVAGVDPSSVTTSTCDIQASYTMEGGVMLPEPGSPEERAWMASGASTG